MSAFKLGPTSTVVEWNRNGKAKRCCLGHGRSTTSDAQAGKQQNVKIHPVLTSAAVSA